MRHVLAHQSWSRIPRHSRRRRAFTLIEVIVVVGIVSFVIPIVMIVLFVILRQQLTVARLTLVKQQGDQALAVIERVIERQVVGMRNGLGPICETVDTSPQDVSHFILPSGDRVSFVSADGTFVMTTASPVGADPSSEPLINPAKVQIESGSLVIQCIKPATYAHALVAVDFILQPAPPISSEEQQALRMRYSTKIMLRR